MWRKGGPFCTVGGNVDWCSHCGKQCGDTSKIFFKIKNVSVFDLAIPLLGICLKEPKTIIQKNISTPIFIAVLFTIAKIWKQPKCPSVDKTIMGHLHNGILLGHKKEKLTFCDSMDGLLGDRGG